MKQSAAWTIAGALGGALFLVFFLVFVPDNLVVALVAAVAGLVAGGLIFSRGSGGGAGLGVDNAARLKAGWEYQKRLEELARRAPNKAVRAKIQDIADIVARILKNLRDDPADMPKAGQFLDYYLPSTVAVVGKYLDLLGRASSREAIEALRGTEATLGTIQSAFERLYQQMLENELLDLGVELKVLNTTIKMEGLGEEISPKP